ncbi:protein of unknown function [Clostridium beijerinckii]|nr:protein of unknown function [Clostridium beijerinckii]
MVNELDEYIFILNHLIKGNMPPIGDINFNYCRLRVNLICINVIKI